MKTSTIASRLLILFAIPLGLFAQNTPNAAPPARSTPAATYESSPDDFGAREGDMEFTLGGGGLSNDELDSSAGGVAASLGYYFNDTLEVVVRQTIDYMNPDGGDSDFAGSTRVALDQHFLTGRARPFVGINAGFIYGDSVEETLTAGLEGGLKFYVQPRTFLFGLAEYAWNFDDSDDADDTIDDGSFRWTVGIGFNF